MKEDEMGRTCNMHYFVRNRESLRGLTKVSRKLLLFPQRHRSTICPSSQRRPHLKTRDALRRNKDMVMGPDGARKQETRNQISVLRWTRNLKGRENLGNLSVNVTIILKEPELEVADSIPGSCEHGNELPVSVQ
jgi:hypothetical protein